MKKKVIIIPPPNAMGNTSIFVHLKGTFVLGRVKPELFRRISNKPPDTSTSSSD